MITPENCRILLVDDEEGIRYTLSCLLKKEGYQVDAAAGHVDAIICLQSAHYDLAFVDIMLAGESGIDVLNDIRAISPATQVVMITGRPEVKTAAEAVRLGAFDYLTKPVLPKTFLLLCRVALHEKKMNDQRERYRANMDAIFHSVSDSIVMIDNEGRLAHFNETAGKICGYSSDMVGRELSDINLGCGGTCRTALLETLRSKSPKTLRRFECAVSDRTASIVSFKSSPILGQDGSIGGAVAVIRDETPVVELEHSLKKRGKFYDFIGISDQMQRVYALIEALADVPTTVLIHGESGTGKELAASALHYAGVRSKGPFVKVNCSALSESLLESELFGHVRGSFTGAIADKEGRFKKADGGTIFLDEIGDISPNVQKRLLRVLQEREFERVGESTTTKVDVRVIAATNRSLTDMVAQGLFRQDLYYRLNVVRMELPALRARNEDIALLTEHFLTEFNIKFNKNVQAVSSDVMKFFYSHPWPGNIRELEHVIEHAVILCKSESITLQNLPQDLLETAHGAKPIAPKASPALTLDQALALCNGNKAQAARLLGVSRLTVYRHLKDR